MELLLIPRYNMIMEQENYNNPKNSRMFIDIMSLYYYIDKSTLEDILPQLLSINCGVSAFGYNKSQDAYWFKKDVYSKIVLSVEIEIISKNIASSTIKFVFFTGTQKQITDFMNKFAESLESIRWLL
jgi:hypothetical protein